MTKYSHPTMKTTMRPMRIQLRFLFMTIPTGVRRHGIDELRRGVPRIATQETPRAHAKSLEERESPEGFARVGRAAGLETAAVTGVAESEQSGPQNKLVGSEREVQEKSRDCRSTSEASNCSIRILRSKRQRLESRIHREAGGVWSE
jgi:hypothetical protein